jgi:hypothetical protein
MKAASFSEWWGLRGTDDRTSPVGAKTVTWVLEGAKRYLRLAKSKITYSMPVAVCSGALSVIQGSERLVF